VDLSAASGQPTPSAQTLGTYYTIDDLQAARDALKAGQAI